MTKNVIHWSFGFWSLIRISGFGLGHLPYCGSNHASHQMVALDHRLLEIGLGIDVVLGQSGHRIHPPPSITMSHSLQCHHLVINANATLVSAMTTRPRSYAR
jgi:hypothetical protein